MSDLLTQKEIDELMASIQTGAPVHGDAKGKNKSAIKIYDFKTAKRVPRDNIKTFYVIYESFSRLLVTYLNATLGVPCDASVVSIEEQTYVEFTNAASNVSVLSIIKMPPLKGSILMRLSSELSYSILDCLLGGADSPSKMHRMFTDIDLVILEKVIRQILILNNDAWEKILKINTVLDGIETNVQFTQIVPPNDTILLITLSIEITGKESLMNFCLPYTSVEPISKLLNDRLISSGAITFENSEETTRNILKKIEPTNVFLKAYFNETTITMDEILTLKTGDVIQLEHKLTYPINIEIGHIPRLKGILGAKSKYYAIKITQICDEEENINER